MPRPSLRRASSSAIKKYLRDLRHGNSSAKVKQIAEEQNLPIPEIPPLEKSQSKNVGANGSESGSKIETTSSPFSKAVVSAMRRLYPEALADSSFDNTGLLLEAPFDPLHPKMNSVILTVDLTKAVVEEALERRDSVIVAYHPVISNGLRSLTLGEPKQQSLLRLASAGISVYSPHTSVEAINGGMADWLCDIITGSLHEADPEAEIPSATSPHANHDPDSPPIDNFVLIDNDIDPFTEHATVSDTPLVNGSIQKTNSQSSEQASHMKRSHSQPSNPTDRKSPPQPNTSSSQEPIPHSRKVLNPSSFFSLNSLPSNTPYTASNTGFGRLVSFSTPQTLTHLIDLIARGLGNPKGFAIAIPQSARVEDMRISTVGVCSGSGNDVLKDCITTDKEKSVDLLFTGELGHHEALAATESGAAVVALFHSNSERGFLHAVMRGKLEEAVGQEWKKMRTQELGREGRRESWDEVLSDESVTVDVSRRDRDPFGIVVLQESGVEGTTIT